MKTPLNTHLAILLLILGGVATSEEIDPFANVQKPDPFANAQEPEREFATTGGFTVIPEVGRNPEIIPSEDWPKIENPTNFNRYFDRADEIWKVDGGYFGAFGHRMRVGGALFFATDKASNWTRIIDTPILQLQRFEGDTFLATGDTFLAMGGCIVDNNSSGGAAYLITRRPSGEWHAKKVFSSWRGVPRILGTSSTGTTNWKVESKSLIVFCLGWYASESIFGADASGAIHYLGVTPRTSEQAGAGQPATKPADKPPVKDQPSTPTPKDVPR